jgi:hypothetical protein
MRRAVSLLSLLVGLTVMGPPRPAAAGSSHPGGVRQTCPEILDGHASSGHLRKTTEPADGSEVHPGDTVHVTLRWHRDDFDADVLHKALDCVTVDGDLVAPASVQERDTDNDGLFEHAYTVPGDAPPGSRLCDRGFVSGPGESDDFERQTSNDVCFVVVPTPTTTTTTATTTTTRPEVEVTPIPIIRAQVAQGGRAGTEVESVSLTSPAPHDRPPSVLVAAQEIPATGAEDRTLVALAGLAFLTGGAAVAAAAPRRPRP